MGFIFVTKMQMSRGTFTFILPSRRCYYHTDFVLVYQATFRKIDWCSKGFTIKLEGLVASKTE